MLHWERCSQSNEMKLWHRLNHNHRLGWNVMSNKPDWSCKLVWLNLKCLHFIKQREKRLQLQRIYGALWKKKPHNPYSFLFTKTAACIQDLLSFYVGLSSFEVTSDLKDSNFIKQIMAIEQLTKAGWQPSTVRLNWSGRLLCLWNINWAFKHFLSHFECSMTSLQIATTSNR